MLLYFSAEAFYGTIRQLKIIFSLFYSSLKNALKVTNSKTIFGIINYQKMFLLFLRIWLSNLSVVCFSSNIIFSVEWFSSNGFQDNNKHFIDLEPNCFEQKTNLC
jgi:hypothetical protein